jgi:hypothetical protein
MARTTSKTTTAKAKTTVENTETITTDTNSVETELVTAPTEAQSTVNTEVPTKRVFNSTDGILCRSVIAGKLGMIGERTGIPYEWIGRGDTIEVEYQDLAAAIRMGKKHIKEPYFVILDNDFIEEFPQVAKIYNDMFSTGDIQEIFTLPVKDFKNAVLSLPVSVQNTVKNIASTMISNGTLDSVQKIKILDEIFGTKLMLLTELYD